MPYAFDVYGTLLDVDAAAREAASETGMEVLPQTGWACRSMADARAILYMAADGDAALY